MIHFSCNPVQIYSHQPLIRICGIPRNMKMFLQVRPRLSIVESFCLISLNYKFYSNLICAEKPNIFSSFLCVSRHSSESPFQMAVGCRVRRGRDWEASCTQDGGPGLLGTVTETKDVQGTIMVSASSLPCVLLCIFCLGTSVRCVCACLSRGFIRGTHR